LECLGLDVVQGSILSSKLHEFFVIAVFYKFTLLEAPENDVSNLVCKDLESDIQNNVCVLCQVSETMGDKDLGRLATSQGSKSLEDL
jgi:hypothetical protein